VQIGRFNIADQPQEKLHELMQQFGFARDKAATAAAPQSPSKTASSYSPFASDISNPMGSFGIGTGLNSAGAVQGYGAYGAYGIGALNQNGLLAAGTYYPVASVPTAAGYAVGSTIVGGVGTMNAGKPWWKRT
jgi:hypothetical protein